jgi:hypothetical protein
LKSFLCVIEETIRQKIKPFGEFADIFDSTDVHVVTLATPQDPADSSGMVCSKTLDN